jgi:hypothetical protein
MKNPPFASIIALVCALVILVLLFVSVSIVDGEVRVSAQLPMHFTTYAGALVVIEALLSFLIPAVLLALCVLVVVEERRKNASMVRVKRYFALLAIPIGLRILSAIEETIYILLYEGRFSLEYTWTAFLTAAFILVIYTMTATGKFQSGLWLVITALVFAAVEVAKLIFPEISFAPYAYVVDNNVYLSTFAAAVLFYLTYACLGISIVSYQHKRK